MKTNSSIPRTIHFTWKKRRVPEEFRYIVNQWHSLNPDFQIKIWSDDDNNELLKNSFVDFYDIYTSYKSAISKTDVARVFILYKFGGVYVDLDVECYNSIRSIIENARLFVSVEPESHSQMVQPVRRGLPFVLCNAFMGSVPGHAFWEHVRDKLKEQAATSNVLDCTGPFLLTGAAMTAPADLRPKVVMADTWSPRDKDGRLVADSAAFVACVERSFQRVPGAGAPLVGHLWKGTWWRHQVHKPRGLIDNLRWSWRSFRRSDLRFGSEPPTLVIQKQDLVPLQQTPRLLLATPMKNVETVVDRYATLIESLSYPRSMIDIAIVYGDSEDKTEKKITDLQVRWTDVFRSVTIERVDLGGRTPQQRWRPEWQLQQRSAIAHCRNRLLNYVTDKHTHCLFIDADVADIPSDIIQSMLSAQEDVVMANCVDENGKPFDLNAFLYECYPWFEYLYDNTGPDGLLQPPLGWPRLYLNDLRYLNIAPLDCVGGTALMVSADVFRSGVCFPERPYRYHIETEGFGLMARDRGFSVVGMPNLKIVHHRN